MSNFAKAAQVLLDGAAKDAVSEENFTLITAILGIGYALLAIHDELENVRLEIAS